MADDLTRPVPLHLRYIPLRTPAASPRAWTPKTWRTFHLVLATAAVLYVAAFSARAYVRKYQGFLPDYARWSVLGTAPLLAAKPTHVFVLFTDHFEPTSDGTWPFVDRPETADAVRDWGTRYAAMAAHHRDSAGRPPQHTFFYPGDQPSPSTMLALRDMVAAGLGEVEFHYHHGWDTEQSLRERFLKAIHEFQQYGFLKTIDGKTQFAFIHGNNGLDNSDGKELCGVNSEIRLLRELGSFADFTFPTLFDDAQPAVVNSIYAVKDDDGPKSYDRRLPLTTLGTGQADLMIFEGPLIFSPTWNPRRLFLHLDDADVHPSEHATPARADAWVRANVHVPERPDWVFVKMFSHGVSNPEYTDAVTGKDFDATLSYFEREYNDGVRYVLHYITAREAYNLARAAAEGARGEPEQYLNAFVQPYAAGPPTVSAGPVR